MSGTLVVTAIIKIVTFSVLCLVGMKMDPAIGASIIGALATLATGFAAVGGAIVIGLKQEKIGKKQTEIQADQATALQRQTEILAEQSKIAEATLRSGVFDRRMSVYVSAMTYVANFNQMNQMRNAEFRENFSLKVQEGQFLFNDEVKLWLRDVWYDGHRLAVAYDMILEERDQDRREELNQEIQDILYKKVTLLAEMVDLFKEDLTI